MGDVAFLADLYGSSGCTTVNVIRCTKALNTVARMNFTPTGNNVYLHSSLLHLWIWMQAITGMTYMGHYS